MNELNIENLEWLLMVAMEEKENCQYTVDKIQKMYFRTPSDLENSPSYKYRMSQLNSAEVCIAVISEQILKLKAS